MTEDDFKAGQESGLILGELKSLSNSLDELKTSFHEFRTGQGERIENAEKDIVLLKDKVDDLVGAKKWVIVTVLGSILSAILSFFVRRNT